MNYTLLLLTDDLTIDSSALFYRSGWRAGFYISVAIPAAITATYTYTGSEQTYNLATSELYTITGNVQTYADAYTVTVSLKDTDNYVWSDNTTADKTYDFVIWEASVDAPAAITTTFTYTGSAQTYNLTTNDLYTISNNVKTDAGEYTVTVALADNTPVRTPNS